MATHGTLLPAHLPYSSVELVGCDSVKATSELPSFRHQFSVLSFWPLASALACRFIFLHPVQAVHIFGVEVLPGQGFILLFHLKPCTGNMAGYAAAMGAGFIGKPNTVFIQLA